MSKPSQTSAETELEVIGEEQIRKEENQSLLAEMPKTAPTTDKKTPVEECEDDDGEDDIDYQADTVMTILKPVSITMLFVIIAVKTIEIPGQGATVGGFMVYNESASDSTATRFFGSLLNALIFLASILVTTIIFVILYKYRCMKIIYGWLMMSSILMLGMFGGLFFLLSLQALNIPFDWIAFSFIIWNFAVVGIVTIFWHGPTKINQGYLIAVSGLLAIFFTRMPDWTTFAILAIVAIYDLFAVLCPKGPLKILVETAQERKEPIPALLYNASVYLMMANPEDEPQQTNQQPEPELPKRRGVKLGLGDFVFYSVLIGRAAMADMMTVFACFIAIITGLFLTLLLLAIFRKALPALPISIALGIIFYFVTHIVMVPYQVNLSSHQLFV